MKKKTTLSKAALLMVGLLALATPAFGVHPEERSDLENLRKRIEALEKEKAEEPLLIETLSKKLRFSGLLELEAAYARVEGGDEASDLALVTAQIGVEALINDYIGGHIILLHEEGEDQSVVVDEAVITLGCSSSFCPGDFSLVGGKMYLPFGKFNSHFISDPLTLDLGETNNTALYVGWTVAQRIDLKVGVFSGETDTFGDNDTIDSWVASLEGTPIEDLTLGASYISDLAESDIGLVTDADLYRSSVPGAAVYLSAAFGSFTLEGEYVTATRSFDAPVVAAGEDLTGKQPSAWNVELALAPNDRWEVAVKAEGADDFLDDLHRYGGVVSYGLFQNTVVGPEYLLGDQREGDEERSHTVTAQLAFVF
jgi:hypothetical protein